jgi:hypothetical protein
MKRSAPHTPDVDEGARRLRRHARDCEPCRGAGGLDADALARLLSSDEPDFDSESLTVSVLQAARPELARVHAALRDAARLRRRTYARAALALLALPPVLLYAAVMVRVLYTASVGLLGVAAADALVGAQTALLALLFGATYATIPLFVERSTTRSPALARGGV